MKKISGDLLDKLKKFSTAGSTLSNGSCLLLPSPTGNCQLYIIGQFNSLLQALVINGNKINSQPCYIPSTKKGVVKLNKDFYYRDKTPKYEYDEAAFTEILHHIYTKYCSKPILCIDIKNFMKYTTFINSYFKGSIVSKTKYKSTNGSNMIIYLLDTRIINTKLKK